MSVTEFGVIVATLITNPVTNSDKPLSVTVFDLSVATLTRNPYDRTILDTQHSVTAFYVCVATLRAHVMTGQI